MSRPRKEHWIVFNKLFMYFCRIKDYAICYQGKLGGDSGKLDVHGLVDTKWDGDLDRWRSTSGYVFNMFSGEISWMTKIRRS
jgi:hypothetical protein